MADEVFLPPMPAPDATLDELRTAFRQLLTWAVAREPLSDGGDTQKFVTAQVDGGVTLSEKGHIKAGQSAWAVGTGMFMGYSAGVFRLSLGNTRAGMIWDGATLTVIGNGVFSGSLSGATGTFSGTLKVGTTPAVSGTTMTGSGAVFNSSGTFAIGNATTNVTFNGTTLTLNGAIVTAANLSLGALSASLSGTFTKTTSASGTHVIGTPTVSASGGTAPYTYAWGIVDQGNDLNNGDYLYLTGTLNSTTAGLSGYLSTGTPQTVSATVFCVVTDANGRVVTPTNGAFLTHT